MTPREVLGDDSPAIAALVDDTAWDLGRPITHEAEVAPILADMPVGREILRHSTAHVLAQAVCSLFPEAKYAIGPAIEDGFYYDFDVPVPFTPTTSSASTRACARSSPRTSPSCARS